MLCKPPEDHLNEFAQGVAYIPLAFVGSISAVIPAIATATNFSFYGPVDQKIQVLNYLREKQILLILDNVEHLLIGEPLHENIRDFLIEILQQAPGVKLLVTSREILNLQGEWIFEVLGLAFPGKEQTGEYDEFDAVALFVQRARRAFAGFTLNEENRVEVGRICRLVEGMPLAIELAGTWVRTLSPAEIAEEIERNMDFLSANARDLPERHRSMQVVFDNSWKMLSTDEQRVLSNLSVFRGGFSRQAAEKVAGATVSILSRLVNRTLLRRAASGRYELHELVRQYCAVHLAADHPAQASAKERHYAFYLALSETADHELKGGNQLEWLSRLEQEHDNLRAALEWALERDRGEAGNDELALRLSGTLRWFWRMRGHFQEGRDWLMEIPPAAPGKPHCSPCQCSAGTELANE